MVATHANRLQPYYEGGRLRPLSDGSEAQYHLRARPHFRPDPEVRLAAENQPFAVLVDRFKQLDEVLSQNPAAVQDALAKSAEEFLRATWPMLEESLLGFPVSFSLDEADSPAEQQQFNALIERNHALGLTSQASEEMPRIFSSFVEMRTFLRTLRRQHLLLAHVVLPDQELPWWLLTAPVWFVCPGCRSVTFDTRSSDPHPDEFVTYMVKRLGTQRLADWYQLWNRRSRPFSDYKGDTIPRHVLDNIETARHIFDFVVIATPYHDVASREWADPNWQRLIDPYLLGFSTKLPSSLFFLGRWSNTGLFPLASQMVAHTMSYLAQHREKIRGFGSPFWANIDTNLGGIRDDRQLVQLAIDALEAYRNKCLFQWLTEGRPSPSFAF